MKKYINFLIKSIAAGWCIGLGGLINLSLPNKYAGALAFSIGIYMVMIFGMKLVTGFVPSTIKNYEYLKLIKYYFICLIGNFIGTAILAFSVQEQTAVIERAKDIILNKTTFSSALLGGIGCGIIIGLIVLNSHKVLKWVFAAPLIAIFILTKMEHCVADMFYMFVSGTYNIPFLLFVILGNLIGGTAVGIVVRQKETD